ncbi:hypothetical protein [Candidatus Electronema sp. PJ]|uniref:hypothetical protein n=1 Tax=Candidatus Electronema sp. PJ TaxID=3401572 RepID=UPI003AA7FFC0
MLSSLLPLGSPDSPKMMQRFSFNDTARDSKEEGLLTGVGLLRSLLSCSLAKELYSAEEEFERAAKESCRLRKELYSAEEEFGLAKLLS